MTQIETKHIRTDGGTQARAGLNNEKVNEYKELLRESGGEWPFKDPIVVFYDGTDYWLADGFHRFHACWTGGRYTVEADVRQGTRREAQLHAVGANADHGLPRTADDKRRAVTLLLEDAEWGRWSDREIARQCRVSPTFVGNLRKELGTVHVDSERVYTRNGEERVMDTANIGGKPLPYPLSPFYVGEDAQQPEIQPALDGYLRRTFSRAHLPKIIEVLINRAHPDSDFRLNQASRALGARPGHIRNAALVLKNSYSDYQVDETAVSHPTPDQIEGLVTRAANDVIDDGDLADYAALYHRWLDDGPDDPDWHHLEKRTTGIPNALVADALRSCYRRVATEETAVSAPDLMTDIMADVGAYEAETAQLFAAAPAPRRATYTDTRLVNLNTALDLVTRLTADTSLTVDIVGPLARALNFMEDAKKALTKRQQYIAWLRDYQDDDGRRWTDLTDTQTWHKNSPCYQAFVNAFPGEDFVKSALMDAKTQLEKETAVVQEVSA